MAYARTPRGCCGVRGVPGHAVPVEAEPRQHPWAAQGFLPLYRTRGFSQGQGSWQKQETTPAGCETRAVILWCEDFFQVIFTICCLTLMLVLIIYGPSLKAEVEAEC